MKKQNQQTSQETFALSEKEKEARNTALGKSTNIADTTAAAVNPIYTDLGDTSAWKAGQIKTRTGSTTRSFNNTLASQRLRANLSGFGYNQPTEQAGETAIENARASELSKIPGDVETESIPIRMAAAQGLQSMGSQQSNAYAQAATDYNPESYYSTGVSQQDTENQRRYGFWKGLAGLATGIGTSLIMPGGLLNKK